MKEMCECGTCPRCKSRERTRSARAAKRNMASAKQKPLEFERIRLTLSPLDIFGQNGIAHDSKYGEL